MRVSQGRKTREIPGEIRRTLKERENKPQPQNKNTKSEKKILNAGHVLTEYISVLSSRVLNLSR